MRPARYGSDGEGNTAPTGGEAAVAVRLHETLGSAVAPALCRTVREVLTPGVGELWLDLEDVKAIDVVGLAVLLQTRRVALERGASLTVLPSPNVYRALLQAAILDEVTLAGPGAWPGGPVRVLDLEERTEPAGFLAGSARVGLRAPAWDELSRFEGWADEPLLDQMVGSHLLYLCRHLGPFHPDFVAQALHDATSLTLLVQPVGADPVGFVRLFNVRLDEGFAFLETAIAHPRLLRGGFGVEASRLALAWAMDVLEIRRVETKVFAYNVLSVNSLRRNGFQQEGTLRQARTYAGERWDILVFAILEDEMRRQRARERFPDMGLWADARP